MPTTKATLLTMKIHLTHPCHQSPRLRALVIKILNNNIQSVMSVNARKTLKPLGVLYVVSTFLMIAGLNRYNTNRKGREYKFMKEQILRSIIDFRRHSVLQMIVLCKENCMKTIKIPRGSV